MCQIFDSQSFAWVSDTQTKYEVSYLNDWILFTLIKPIYSLDVPKLILSDGQRKEKKRKVKKKKKHVRKQIRRGWISFPPRIYHIVVNISFANVLQKKVTRTNAKNDKSQNSNY